VTSPSAAVAVDPHAEYVLGTLEGWPDPPRPAVNEYGHVPYGEGVDYRRARTLNMVRRRPGLSTRELSDAVGFYCHCDLHWWLKRGQLRKVNYAKAGRHSRLVRLVSGSLHPRCRCSGKATARDPRANSTPR
jgi:hypothetical protein